MTEQELRENFIKKLTKLLYDLDINIYVQGTNKIFATFGLAKEDIEHIADRLIAAGIGDVKDLQAQVDALEITNIALHAGYDDAEKDRLYWVNKYKEAERRVAKAERALVMSCANMVKDEKSDVNIEHVIRVLYYKYLKQAEKELTEEEKDEQS